MSLLIAKPTGGYYFVLMRVVTGTLAVVAVVGALILALRESEPESVADREGSRKVSNPQHDPGDRTAKTRKGHDEGRSNGLKGAIKGYDALSKKFTGDSLASERVDYVLKATRDLPAMDTCQLLEYVADDLDEDSLGSIACVMPGTMQLALSETHDLADVTAWILTVGNPYFQSKLLAEAGRFYAYRDPTDFYRAISSGSARDQFIAGYFAKHGEGTAEGFPFDSVLKFAEGGASFPKLEEVLQGLPNSADFSQLQSLLKSRDTALSSGVLDVLLKKWASKDPKGAAAFLESAPSALKADAYGSMSRILETSGGTAIRMMETLPASPEKDAVIQSAIRGSKKYSSKTAWAIAQGVSDPQMQETLLDEIYAKWSHEDPKAAEAALAARANDSAQHP